MHTVDKLHPRDLPEALTTLYLRLNGFFTTGLVLHSESWGEVRGDVDCLAVWHPCHDQSERGVAVDPSLGLGTTTELLICEIKSSLQSLSFNQRLRTDRTALNAIVRWSGLVTADHMDKTVDALLPLLQDDAQMDAVQRGVSVDGVRIRPLLCCPRCPSDQRIARWCIRGDQMMAYANLCLNPQHRRARCSTRYPLDLWGGFLEPLITYFKNLPHDALPKYADLQAQVASAG
jgi:hypothetical protein